MGLSFLKILGILNILGFLLAILFTKGDKNRLYIKYILLSYPLLSLFVIPMADGFDIITIVFILFFHRKRQVQLYNGAIYTTMFGLLALVILTGLFLGGQFGSETMHECIAFLSIFAFAKILIDECLYDQYFFYNVLYYLKITLVVSFFFLGGQILFGVEAVSLIKTFNPNIMLADATRYPSFLSDPQTYSQFLAALSFICMIRDPREEKFNKLNYVFVVFALVSILMAGGRAGLLGWTLGMTVVVLFGNASYRYALVIAIIALYVIAVNFGDNFAIFKRSGDMSETYEFRHGIWMDALTIFQKNPFFGIGLGNYANYVEIHHPDQFLLIDNEPVYFDQPESGYLKFLTELGGLGFISIFIFILVPMIRSFIYYLISKDTSLILLIAAVLSWMVGFYSTYSFGDTRIKLMIVTLLCLLITSRQRLEAIYDDMHEDELIEDTTTDDSIT